jgi:DNA-binding NarL/FixJ family response regulator
VRAGLRSLVKEMAGIDVVAEAADGREVLRLVAIHHPLIVLMDILMPELNGLDATARLTASAPDTRVIMVTMHSTADYVLQALRSGAVGYVLKDSGSTELEQAIRAVARGEMYLSAAVSKHVVTGFLHGTTSTAEAGQQLTLRQREVLQLIAEGNSTKEIARKLDIGTKTVETHRMQLMNTLDIHDVAGLVRFAIRTGLIPPDA